MIPNGKNLAHRDSVVALIAFSFLMVGALSSCSQNPLSDSRLAWTFQSPKKAIWSNKGFAKGPEVAGNYVVYVGGYPWLDQVYLYAIDARTGKNVWTSKEPIRDFMVSGDAVYATTLPSTFKREPGRPLSGSVVAYELSSGETLWSIPFETTREPRFLSIGNYLYCLNSENQTVVALDPTTGKTVWETPKAGLAITARGNQIYAEQPDRSVAIANGITNKMKGQIKLVRAENEGARSLFVDQNKLIVLDPNGYVFTADLEKQSIIGPIQIGIITTKIVIKGNIAYFGCADPDVVAKSDLPKDESQMHERAPSNLKLPGFATPVRSKEELKKEDEKRKGIVRTAGKSYAMALDLETGKALWKTEVATTILVGPVLGDQSIYFGTSSKEQKICYAFDDATGKLQWQVATPDPIRGAAYEDGVVYLNAGQSLLAINSTDGKQLWSFKMPEKEYGTTGNPVPKGNLVYMVGEDANLYALKNIRTDKKSAAKTTP